MPRAILQVTILGATNLPRMDSAGVAQGQASSDPFVKWYPSNDPREGGRTRTIRKEHLKPVRPRVSDAFRKQHA